MRSASDGQFLTKKTEGNEESGLRCQAASDKLVILSGLRGDDGCACIPGRRNSARKGADHAECGVLFLLFTIDK